MTFLQSSEQLPALGKGFRLVVQDWQKVWFGHPSPVVDIAVCPLAPLEAHIREQYGITLFHRYVSNGMIPSEEQIKELDAIEPITFIGYPNGIWDRKNFLPVARRGTTASPIEVDFEDTPQFVIDASVFGGSSGSPVFILNQGTFSTKRGALAVGSRLLFVGVIAAVFFRKSMNEIVAVPVPTQVRPMAQQQEMLDLGIVVKARTVVETIEALLSSRGISLQLTTKPSPPAHDLSSRAATES